MDNLFKMNKKLIIIILCIILIVGIFYNLFDKDYLKIKKSIGISNGKPYCISCYNLYTNIIKPKIGDYAIFSDKDGFIFHRVINIVDDYYIFSSDVGNRIDIVKDKDVIFVNLFEIPFINKKTDDFMYACEYEENYFNESYNCAGLYKYYEK